LRDLTLARKRAKNIKALVLDVDGVLTDGGIILDGNRNEYKKFNVRDGHGIKLLVKAGIRVAIVTGRESKVVGRRAKELGITHIYQRCYDKGAALDDINKKLGIKDAEIAYMGDDIVDIPVMRRAALPIAVSDADSEAIRHALFITKTGGGKGAVREAAEFILKAKGLWNDILRAYNQD
jgi:3-deoxy-D-manno-octulosonate 8-phosphate phosphatase (KDO 8-P phosphatase)